MGELYSLETLPRLAPTTCLGAPGDLVLQEERLLAVAKQCSDPAIRSELTTLAAEWVEQAKRVSASPQNHPLDSAKTRKKKATQTIPLVFISGADPGQLGIEIFGPNVENDADRVSIPLFERPVRKWPISRSSPTASSATCTRSRWWAWTVQSTGAACRTSTRQASSPRFSTSTKEASSRSPASTRASSTT